MSEELLQKNDQKKTFWKTVRAYLFSHIGGVLISLIFCFGLASFLADGLYWLMIPLILFLYSYPLYGTMWNAGLRDLNAAKHGHLELKRTRGLLYGVTALTPWILLSLGLILSKFGLLFNYVVPYKFLNAEVWPIINFINASMYLPDIEIWQILLMALSAIAIPLIIGEFAYIMGTYDISIKQKLIYANKDKNKPNNPVKR